jgi:DNA modification methylase
VNELYYGDNLKILRDSIATESVDLIYLDPPFNSNRSYNVLFKSHAGVKAAAQIEAFDDTWNWSQQTEELFDEIGFGATDQKVADALIAMKRLLGENDVMAYLVMMTARLIELHRVLKPTGSIYLHCDPTASHYLKVMMDAIFGPANFRSEITWQRTSTHNDAKRWSPNADNILYYGKTNDVVWNPVYLPHSVEYVDDKYRHDDGDGRRYRLDNITSPNPRPNLTYEWKGHAPPPNGWRYSRETMERLDSEGRIWYPDSKSKRPQLKRYLDEQDGPVAGNVWTDIAPINSRAAERLGYPTQKPLALLERIIEASSNPGDLVLDPFCGCGTAVDAAQKLDRKWIGIDITYLAVDLIEKRLERTYGDDILDTYVLSGVPKDAGGAQRLFEANPFDFERWAVSLVDGQPNEKQVGDKGRDGLIRFQIDKNDYGSVVVSVKGGKAVNPAMVRELDGTVKAMGAEMGVLITMSKPTKGMVDAAQHTGSYEYELSGHKYPKVQIITVGELLAGKRPDMPTPLLPYKLAKARSGQQSML